MPKILILGALPPPIGGVRIHLSRTLEHLKTSTIDYSFVDYTRTPLIKTALAIFRHSIIHAHFSNSYLRLATCILAKAMHKTFVYTYHGNLGRYTRNKNILDRISIRLSDVPIFLNIGSYNAAKKINCNARLITAFVPPSSEPYLPDDVAAKLYSLRKNRSRIYCTSAHNYVYWTNDSDLYGVMDLVRIFSEPSFNHFGLVVSDPSGKNRVMALAKFSKIPDNIIFIDEPHSLVRVIPNCDAYIRATRTDGDALSIRESMHFGVPVIASDCVSRPSGCILYKTGSIHSLKLAINDIDLEKARTNTIRPNSGIPEIIKLYDELCH